MGKQKAKVIDQLVREAIAKKVTEAKEIVKRVQQKLIDMAKDFKCEDVLSTKACDKLREIAQTLKIKAAEVTKMLKEIVAKGIVKAKEIIEKIKAKLFPALENEVIENDTTCEDILAKKICTELRDAATKLKVKAEKIDELIRETIKEKITESKAVIAHVREQLIEAAKNFKCEDALPEMVCTELKHLAAKVKIQAAKVDQVLKEVIAKGITKVKEMIEQIREKLFPADDEEEFYL